MGKRIYEFTVVCQNAIRLTWFANSALQARMEAIADGYFVTQVILVKEVRS